MTEDVPVTITRRHSSNSEIQSFKRCRRRWWLSYSLRVAPAPTDGEATNGPLWIGTLVHIGHDARFKAIKAGASNASSIKCSFLAIKSAVHRRFKRGWQVDYDDVELARIMLEGYWEWEAEEGVLAEFDVLDTEVEMQMDITLLNTGEIIVYMGKADVVARHKENGYLWIIDKKTVGSLLDPAFGLQRNEQMLGYIMLLRHTYGEHVDGAMYSMLRKVKRTARANPPFYAQVEVRYNATEHRRFQERLQYVLQDIMALRDKVEQYNVPGLIEVASQLAYPSPTADCSWDCQFVNVCSMFDDGSRVEDVLREQFVPKDPLERYDSAPHEVIPQLQL